MKRYWLASLVLAVVLGIVYWLIPYRFTPMSAIQAGAPVKVKLLLSESYPGGQAVLIERADAGHELLMLRKWGPFYRVMSSATLWPPLNGDQLSCTAKFVDSGSTSIAAVAFGGIVIDQDVVRITAGGLDHRLEQQRYYLFVWSSPNREIWRDAKAYDSAGVVRYQLDGLQWKRTVR